MVTEVVVGWRDSVRLTAARMEEADLGELMRFNDARFREIHIGVYRT
jgi:hypothetical protein